MGISTYHVPESEAPSTTGAGKSSEFPGSQVLGSEEPPRGLSSSDTVGNRSLCQEDVGSQTGKHVFQLIFKYYWVEAKREWD